MWAQRAASDGVQDLPAGQRASVGDVFDPTAVRNQTLLSHHVIKVTGVELGEAVLLGNVDLLTTRELELGSAQSLHHVLLVLGLGTHGHDHLTDVHAGHGALGFTKSTTHSSLEPVSSSTGQHFVDADDVEGVQTHADVETVLTAGLHHVLVSTDTGSFQSYRG